MNSNLLFSRKDIAKILLPLVLQNILTITIGMVDSIMVSGTARRHLQVKLQYGEKALRVLFNRQ